MTNEELVSKIQAGERELITELWLQIERFVKQQAYKFASYERWSSVCASAGITDEDLYVAGYFALENAIEKYDADKDASFLTYFGNFYLKRAFYDELGLRSRGGKYSIKPNLLSLAKSIDEQVYEGKDGSARTLEDYLEDMSAQEAFADVEDALYNQQLHADLEEALASLRPRDAQILRDHYYNLLSPAEQSEKYKISLTNVRNIRMRALEILRKHYKLKNYRERFIGTTAFTSLQSWKDTGMSQQERIIIKLDEYERKLGLKG